MVQLIENPSLLAYNTFGVDVPTRFLASYQTEADLAAWLPEAAAYGPLLPIGQGSNLLFTAPWEGCVLTCTATGRRLLSQEADQVRIQVEAGAVWDTLARDCAARGWYGTENLGGIPGTVGAAAVQNIGAYGAEVARLIEEVRTLDRQGRVRVFARQDCGYGYRQSRFKQDKDLIVTAVTLRLRTQGPCDLRYGNVAERVGQLRQARQVEGQAEAKPQQKPPQPEPLLVYEAICQIRSEKLPDYRQLPNAGSFFMNPVVPAAQARALAAAHPQMPQYPTHTPGFTKLSAAWLIEQAGWKGRRQGPAGVFDRHALILVNHGGASGAQVRDLALAIRQDVQQRFGVELTPEVQIL